MLGASTLLAAAPARAVDHNNIDANRPLRFDDAETLGFGELAFETGLSLGWPRRRPLGLGLAAEAIYGIGLNTHVSLGFDPSLGGRAGSRRTGFDFGEVGLSAQHNFNREYNNTPAFSLRSDMYFPTGRDSQGVAFRVRGIASKTVQQYNRLHLNVDLNANPGAGRGEREFNPGLILGYSRPLGYPTKFTRTGLAQLGIQAGPESGTGPVVTAGLGLRKQVTVRSVFDIGIESDIAGFNGAPRDRIRFIIGYSMGLPTR
jgi:hypothetical protein